MKQKALRPASKPQGAASPVAGASHHRFSAELPLHELRQTKALSQVTLARSMHVHQAAISKMEHRSDMYVSTLREYVRALGGDLEIVARFPDGVIKISNFDDQTVLHAAEKATAEGMRPRRVDLV
jgi:predicted transcriptional regulator